MVTRTATNCDVSLRDVSSHMTLPLHCLPSPVKPSKHEQVTSSVAARTTSCKQDPDSVRGLLTQRVDRFALRVDVTAAIVEATFALQVLAGGSIADESVTTGT